MKKVLSIFVVLSIVIGLVFIPVSANAATETFSLTLGQSYTGTVEESTGIAAYFGSNSHEYTFSMDSSSNVTVQIVSNSTSQKWSIKSTDYSLNVSNQSMPMSAICYLEAGKNYVLTITGGGEYAFNVSKAAPDKLSMKSKSCKLSSSKTKTVPFSFTGTVDYAKANLSVKSSKPKVATATFSVDSANAGTLTITPKYIGKTVITLKMAGSNSVKYTVYGVYGYWFVAKGSKEKAPAPAGVSKPKWKSSKTKLATINKKTGKINAKAGGRVILSAKKGKVTYKLSTIITDYIKLGKKTYKQIKSVVNNPEKLKIYNVYSGYSKQIDTTRKIPVVVVDYGSTNENGAMIRNKLMAYYDDVYEARFTNGWSIDNIIGRKSISPSKIK